MNAGQSSQRYPFPWKTGLRLLWDALWLRSRSFRTDALDSLQAFPNPNTIIQKGLIPGEGPCLLVTNHYSRPGFGAWWIALGISAALPVEVHWMMTNAWTHLGPLEGMSRWLFPRLARVYGFTPTPPIPPDPRDVGDRARAVRQVLDVSRCPGAVIALAPEGQDHPGGILGAPPPGVGRFITQLEKHCQRIVPIGVYEEGDYLTFNFGPAFELDIDPLSAADERDRDASQQVMQFIAQQLPPRLRGDYNL